MLNPDSESREEQTYRKTGVWVAGICAALGVYVFSYWMLSRKGRFEISAVGAKGPKGWVWAPAGYPEFPTSGELTWQRLYHPLWVMDCRFWHNDKKTGHPGYPIRQWDEAATPPGYRLMNP